MTVRTSTASPVESATPSSFAVLRELLRRLGRNRARLRKLWLHRILDGQYLSAMSGDEIDAETTFIYDSYLGVLATGDIDALEAYARNLSERIIPLGVQTREVVGIVLLLRDVLARELFSKYGGDRAMLNRVLDAYEPAANRIVTTVSAAFVQERERIIRQQQEAIRELSARRQAEQALRAENQRLEEEARRIAHALHDEAGQLLVSVYLALDTLLGQLQPDARERLTEIRARLEQVEAQLRRLSHELRPTILDDLGLKPAIEFLADGISKRTGHFVRVTGSIGGRLPGSVETAMYRIVQEALTNVIKHAQATQAVVHLKRTRSGSLMPRYDFACDLCRITTEVTASIGARDLVVVECPVCGGRMARQPAAPLPEALVCSISDNGRGFGAKAHTHSQGRGLIGMRERIASLGGTLSIDSRPGRGTTLEIVVPLEGVACQATT
jgi:signal transduction histidine kinase